MRISTPCRLVPCAIVGLVVALAPPPLSAQEQEYEQDAVLKTVQRFFDSMASRDTVMAREALLVEGKSFSTTETSDGPRFSGFTHRDYLSGLSTGTDQWLENMWDPEVRVRGTIATVWAPYEFRINSELSHCGVDAFSLVKTQTGWRIASIVYTVELDCD